MNSSGLIQQEIIELNENDYVNYLREISDHDIETTSRMIGLLINNTQSFLQTGFTNSDFTGVQKVLISQFFRDVISDHAAGFFEEIFDDYVNMYSNDRQNPVDITMDIRKDVHLFTLNQEFFKKFRNSVFRKELEKSFNEFLKHAVIDHYYSEDVFNHKSFMNMVLWYLLKRIEPVDLCDPGIKDTMHMTVYGIREQENKSSAEQHITHYLHYINSLVDKNITLYKFKKYYKEKKHLDYWEKILRRTLFPYTIWWAKHCLEEYKEIKFINSLNEIREEKRRTNVRAKICCIFCSDFRSTEENIRDYDDVKWTESVDHCNEYSHMGEKFTFFRRYNILLQSRSGMLYFVTRVGRKNIIMNSFLQRLRNGDVLEFRDCSVTAVPDGDFYIKKLSEIFDGIPIHEISVKNENITVIK